MKSLNQYINEKLKVSKKQYNYYPKTREELDNLLDQLLKERGWEANLNDIDTSNITDMSGLFTRYRTRIYKFKYNKNYNFSKFNGDISEWDVSNVTNMIDMFDSCEKLDCDLSNWDVSNVKNMGFMFYGCKSFEGKGLENWDVSNIINMYAMFESCEKLDCDLSNWDVSNVINMGFMFYECKSFEGKGLENWDVSNVRNMESTFNNCKNLNCDLSKWDVSNLTNIKHMFDDCTIKEKYKPKFR